MHVCLLRVRAREHTKMHQLSSALTFLSLQGILTSESTVSNRLQVQRGISQRRRDLAWQLGYWCFKVFFVLLRELHSPLLQAERHCHSPLSSYIKHSPGHFPSQKSLPCELPLKSCTSTPRKVIQIQMSQKDSSGQSRKKIQNRSGGCLLFRTENGGIHQGLA